MPPSFTDRDPLDQEIDQFLSTLPPIGGAGRSSATDPVDREIDDFLTKMGPSSDEPKFRAWYEPIARAQGLNPDPDDPQHHYDYRAAWRAGAAPGPDGHWPSEFKAPDHPNRFVSGIDTITGQPDLRAPVMIKSQVDLREPITIDLERTRGTKPASALPRPAIPPPPVVTPTLGERAAELYAQVGEAPLEATRAFQSAAMRTLHSGAAAGASMAYPEAAPNIQAVRVHEQEHPIIPLADVQAWKDPRWWGQRLGEAGGSAAALAAMSAVGGSGGFGAVGKAALAGVPEALSEAASIYNDVLHETGDQRKAFAQATDVYAANMALLGLTNTPLFQQGGALLRRTLTGAAIEGSQEAAQTAIGNVASGRPLSEGMAEAAVTGTLAGGLFRAADTRGRPAIPRARDTQPQTPAALPPPVPLAASQGSQTVPAVDPIDQQIDAFLGSLPPVSRDNQQTVDSEQPPITRGSLEAAIVDQYGGQVTTDDVKQLASQARADDISSQPEIRDRARRNAGQPFDAFAGEQAVAHGYRGTAEEAAAEVVRRGREPYEAEHGAVAGHTHRDFLQFIAAHDGIRLRDDDMGGESRRFQESRDERGVNTIAGVQGVFRREGKTWDEMATLLREAGVTAPDGTAIEGPQELERAIDEAILAGREGRAEAPTFDVEKYARIAGVVPGTRWWVAKPVARTQGFDEEQAAVQERAARAVEDDLEGMVQRYEERFGNVLNADNASELFADYAEAEGGRAKYVRAVRAPAAAIVEEVYQRKLDAPVAEGKDAIVLFTGGGNGSGKSSSLRMETAARADIIFDSTLSQVAPSKAKIDAALESGRFVVIQYVYRDPLAALTKGTLPRAETTGRTVPLRNHVATHIGSFDTIKQFVDEYAVEPGVAIEIYENVEGQGLQPRPLDFLDQIQYDPPDVLRRKLEAALAGADASESVRAGTADTPRVGGALPPAGDRDVPQERRGGDGTPPTGGPSGAGTDSPAPRGGLADDDLPDTLSESRGPSRSARSATSPQPARPPALPPVRARPSSAPGDLDEGLGSPTRRVFEEEPVATGAKPPKEPMSEAQAVARLQTIFGHEEPQGLLARLARRAPRRSPLPTKTGRFRERAFGVYKVQPQVIRLKRFGDLATFTHELGHHIDLALFAKSGRPGGALFAGELERLGESTSPKSAPRSVRMAEGVAEFFRLYFPDPSKAREAAPQFYVAFEEVLAANPAMAQQFAQGQEVVQTYLAQDLATRGGARVDFSGIDPDDDPRSVVQKLETRMIDDLADLRQAVETLEGEAGPVPYRENAHVLARLARGAAGKASGFLQFGPRREDGTFLAGSFADAIAPVRSRLQDFSRYLVALRVPELRDRQIETGMTRREAEAIVAKFQSPEFERARDAIYAYQDAVLTYAIRAGALSDEKAGIMRALHRAYVPFHRLLREDIRPGVARRIANRVLPIKRIRGSGADIIDPLESIIKNTHAIVDMVEKNRAMVALAKHATSTTGGGRYIEEIPTPQVATKINLTALQGPLRGALRDAGFEVKTVMGHKGPVLEVDGQVVDLDDIVTVYMPATFAMPGQDLVTVVENGARKFYSVNDRALYEAITQIGARPASIVVALLGAPARALRAGATLTLGFIGRNPVRDSFVAAVQSKYGFKPGVDTARGLFEYLRHGEMYQQFLNSGAAGAALVSGDRKVLQRELRKYADEGRLRDHLRDIVAHPIDALRALSEATETATRLGEFMRAVQKEGRTAEGFTRAALAARDITVDFSRAGTDVRTWNAYAAFLNAQVQGYARMAETFRANPVGATVRATTTITLLSIATWALNHDDEEWRELPEWEKSTYWHIPNPAARVTGNRWWRIPKPFELGAVFGTFFEKALDHITAEDPHAFKRLFADDPTVDLSAVPLQTVKNTAWGIIQAVTPTAVLPWIEVQANYSTFRDRSIVSPFDVDLEPALQYNRWTSETAKVIGKALNYPPAKIDHLIYGYGAGLARDVVAGVEGAAKRVRGSAAAPSPRMSDVPGVGAFVRDVAGSDAESLAEFYRRRDAMEGAARSAKVYKGQGSTRDLDRLRAKFPTIDSDRPRFRQAAEDLKDLRDQVDAIFKDTKLGSDEKRDRLDRTYEKMVNTARAALGKKPLPSRFSGKAVPMARRRE